ncbi:MAG: stalk domain-containing protein [Clostridiaceae bacterium]|nr:stalk domain-containing protein [Clostridiaceae bacterium]
MKQLKVISILCVIILICVLAASPRASAATYNGDTVYYTVVNDAMLDLSYSTMPIMRDGRIYVPYSLFVTYFDVKSSYSAADQVLFLSTSAKLVKFDLQRGIAYDRNQNEIRQAAILSKGQVFIPAEFTANYFGLSFYLLSDASIVRLSDARATYPDAFLAGQFSAKMESMLAALLAGDTASSLASSEATTLATSTVATGTALPVDTTTSLRPTSYIDLSFAVRDTAALPYLLDWLEANRVTARFFVDAAIDVDSLTSIYVAGHAIGVLSSAEDTDTRLGEASAVNDRIFRILRQKTHILYCASPDDALLSEGYILPAFSWTPDSALALGYALDRLSSEGQTRISLLLDCSADVSPLLDSLLTFIKHTGSKFESVRMDYVD